MVIATRSLFDRISSIESVRTGWHRVRDNAGCAGADGLSIADFERDLELNLRALARELRRETYRPLPLSRFLIDRGTDTPRQLCVPAVRDRVAQAAALEALTPFFEAEFEECSFGYRRGRSVRDAVNEIRRHYADGYTWLVDADIDAYFDNVGHSHLLDRLRALLLGKPAGAIRDGSPGIDRESIPPVVRLVERWIRADVWDGSQIYRLKRGIPQGSVISPALANLYLDDLDEAMLTAGQKLVRYADDFVVLCKDRQHAEQAARLTDDVLDAIGLELDKLDITSFDAGFTFLGVTFVRSLVMHPFDRPARSKGVLFAPPPMDPGQLNRFRNQEATARLPRPSSPIRHPRAARRSGSISAARPSVSSTCSRRAPPTPPSP